MAIPITVLIRVRPAAPAPRAAAAISVRSVTLGLSLAHRGARQAAVASTTSAVAAGEWANMSLRPSMFGQLRFTSTAVSRDATSDSMAAALA